MSASNRGMSSARMAAPGAATAACYDEVFAADGAGRPHADALIRELERLGPERLVAAGQLRDALFMRQGITFDLTTADGAVADRPFPLDLVPRIIPATEWTMIKRGLAQRIRALNHFVADVYHEREIVKAKIVPWTLIASRSHFARSAYGIRPPGGVYTHIAGCDLVRDADGRWKVLEDNVRTPSGISYMLENRIAMTRLVPSLFAYYRVRPIDEYPLLLLQSLKSVAPGPEGEATVVVWTPGPANSAYFEHAFLARQMGVELVEASRSRGARRRLLHAHDQRARPRLRHLPPARRRVHRPARVPSRLAARRPGPDPRLPRRHGRDRQRDRHGRRRRQGDLLLRARDDPLLSRRGAAARQRKDIPARRSRAARARTRSDRRARLQANRRVGRSRRRHRAAHRRGAARVARRDGPRRPVAVDRAGARPALDRAERARGWLARAAPRRPAAVRDLRRADPHRPRRPHARRTRGGLDGRQLLARRRLEGHLGAGRRREEPALPGSPELQPFTPPALPDLRLGSWTGQAQQQQQHSQQQDPPASS